MLILAALPLLLAANCQKEAVDPAENSLTVSTETIAAPAEGGQYVVDVVASCDWGAYSSDKRWCTISQDGGVAGNAKVTVTVAANESFAARSTVVTFTYGTLRKTIDVSQEAAEKPVIDDPDIVVPEGYSLVWHDEFLDSEVPENGNDCLVNTANWRFENWAPGKVNHELQRYVSYGVLNGDHTAWVEDGVLNIRAMKQNGQVISARMNSRESWRYGYIEARIKLPKGKGTWPAFWMMPDDQSDGWPTCGEIDIMEEVGVHANYTSSSVHTQAFNHVQNTQKTKEILTPNAEDEFHIYACEWTEDCLRFYTDNKPFFEFRNDGRGDKSTWPFNKKFFIIMNLAWGGDWGGYAGVNDGALPTTMQIDYVRVFQK